MFPLLALSDMANVHVTVSIADDHLDRLLEVAEDLQEHGMKIDQVMDQVGIVTGSCPSDDLPALRQVPGVDHVESAHTFHLSPPHSRIQ
jgi:methylmalonyl-CoA mutase cobalamin-binding subunit